MRCEIRIAETDDEISACFPVIRELRPHLAESDFVHRVNDQHKLGGYRIAYRVDGSEVVAVAGFRILENLAWGRFLYVDDLVTSAAARSQGHGSAMIRWLSDYAAAHDCREFHLDSGVQRLDAHRFYDREGFSRTCLHFALPVSPPGDR